MSHLELFAAERPMILAGGGIHARPDSTAFNIELQRLAETIKSNIDYQSDDGVVRYYLNNMSHNL